MDEINCHKSQPEYSENCESILVPKVFDECIFQKCIELGPVISAEKCTCIIVSPDEDESLGRVILPHKPVYLPELVSTAKVIGDSFKTDKVKIADVSPSAVKKGYWDVEIIFNFTFKVQLYDVNMRKFKILCCPPDCHSLKECDQYKDYLLCSVSYVYTVTLFGSTTDSIVTISDCPIGNEQESDNAPRILVESKAYFIDICIKSPDDLCGCEEVLDGIYDETVILLYVKVGFFLVTKAFRLASILIESCGYHVARPCKECPLSPCELFDEAPFPIHEFFPPTPEL